MFVCCTFCQGVTLEDVQQANEVLRKTDNVDGSTSSTTTTPSVSSSLSDRSSRISGSDWKSHDSTDSVTKDRDSSSALSDRDPSNRLSSDVNLRRTNSALDTDSSSISSWRRSREEGNKKDVSLFSLCLCFLLKIYL